MAENCRRNAESEKDADHKAGWITLQEQWESLAAIAECKVGEKTTESGEE